MPMNWSDDEMNVVALCLRNLSEAEIAECRDVIKHAAVAELANEDYAELLIETAVPALVRSVRAWRSQRLQNGDRPSKLQRK
jgi:hypothetical protein